MNDRIFVQCMNVNNVHVLISTVHVHEFINIHVQCMNVNNVHVPLHIQPLVVSRDYRRGRALQVAEKHLHLL